MNAATGWGILFAIALAVPGAMIGVSQAVGWWWVIASPVPLIAWNLVWLIVVKASRGWRIAFTASVTLICIGVLVFGIRGLVTDAHGQPPPSINGDCSAGSVGGNFSPNCPKTYNFAPPRKPNGLYQDGRFVGTVDGVQPSDDQKHVTLTNPRISEPGIDPSGNFELQNAVIKCPVFAENSHPAANHTFSLFGDTVCDIVGQRQP